jgi:DNA-binding MarR family transcriptional regulator
MDRSPINEPKKLKQDDIGEIVNAIRKINNGIQCYSRELMRKFRITGPQLGALRLIDRCPQISLSELSEQMYLNISTVSGIVDRLEDAGYLRRHRRADDKRTMVLGLSEKGRRVIERSPISGFGTMVQGLAKLPAAELGEINRSMKRLLRLMKIEDFDQNKFYQRPIRENESKPSRIL